VASSLEVGEFIECPESLETTFRLVSRGFRFQLAQKPKNQASGKTWMLYGAGKLSKKIVVQLRALSTVAAPATSCSVLATRLETPLKALRAPVPGPTQLSFSIPPFDAESH